MKKFISVFFVLVMALAVISITGCEPGEEDISGDAKMFLGPCTKDNVGEEKCGPRGALKYKCEEVKRNKYNWKPAGRCEPNNATITPSNETINVTKCDTDYCKTNDGGKNISKQGTDTYYDIRDGKCEKINVTDYCLEDGALWEYVNCRSSGRIVCPVGYKCASGACVKAPPRPSENETINVTPRVPSGPNASNVTNTTPIKGNETNITNKTF